MTTLADLQAFFTREADLLDDWQLPAWLELLAPGVQYVIPPLGAPDANAADTVFLIVDDEVRLKSRVRQLMSHAAWAENPRSRTRRLITNVRIRSEQGSEIQAAANFAVWRFQHQSADVYVGRYENTFVRDRGALRLRMRKVILDMESLNPHGKISFIL